MPITTLLHALPSAYGAALLPCPTMEIELLHAPIGYSAYNSLVIWHKNTTQAQLTLTDEISPNSDNSDNNACSVVCLLSRPIHSVLLQTAHTKQLNHDSS